MEQAKEPVEPLRLVEDTHPLLKTKLEQFKFDGSVDTIVLANQLAELMLRSGGIGLSANQAGLPHRMFVMRTHPTITLCINPRVVDQSSDEVLLEEGCLSYPGLHVRIKRPAHIKVRYQTATGETVTEKITGLTARVFLHELDHMDGTNFLDRAGKMAKDVAIRKYNKMKKLNNAKRRMGYGN